MDFTFSPPEAPGILFLRSDLIQRAAKGGGKLGGGGGTYRKTPPQKRLWTPPHLRYVSPPFFGDSLSFPFKGTRHRPDQPQFLRPTKLVLESTLCSTLPPPNSRDAFCPPPPQPLPNLFSLLLGSAKIRSDPKNKTGS